MIHALAPGLKLTPAPHNLRGAGVLVEFGVDERGQVWAAVLLDTGDRLAVPAWALWVNWRWVGRPS